MRQQEQIKEQKTTFFKKDADVSEAPPIVTVELALPAEVTNNAETFLHLFLFLLPLSQLCTRAVC